jgi:hypothetical protein
MSVAWRNIGPAVTGTRIVELAVVESRPRVVYAGTASSGIWKTVNAGTTWTPVFERAGRISIGGLAVAASNPDVVWVATGEPNMRNLRSTSPGDGVYRSRDGGQTWQHMGLKDSQHMGRLIIHPTNPDLVYASVVGSMSARSAVRAGSVLTSTTVTGLAALPASLVNALASASATYPAHAVEA